MKRLLKLLCLLLIVSSRITAQSVGSIITPLTPFPILTNTSEPPQSKVWTYAGKHWCVMGTSVGTSIFRLDGTSWTNTLTLASGNYIKADIKVVGNLAHIFVYKGTKSVLYSVQYDILTAKYKSWTVRPNRVDITLESGVNATTIDIDGTGRMWLASDGTKDMNVRWSDSPYSIWSAPVKLEINASTTDLCAIVALPSSGKVGVFWSNKVSKRFGFKTHTDGADPTVWSTDEIPASASALNIGGGFAENQFNVKASTTGRLYVSIKTGYNIAGQTQLALLVRQSSGDWDPIYPLTVNDGARPVVIVNDSLNQIMVAYTSGTGNILYKQSASFPISFGTAATLISGAYDNASGVKSSYSEESVIIASDITNVVSVLIKDGSSTSVDVTPPGMISINRHLPLTQTVSGNAVTFRATFSEPVTGVNATDFQLTTISGSASGTLASDAVTPVGSTGTTFDVVAGSLTGNGTFRLDLNPAGTGIADTAGNQISGGFTGGQTYIIPAAGPVLNTVSITSGNSIPNLAKPGDIITLTFTASGPISTPTATIAGYTATVTPGTDNNFTATYTLTGSEAEGTVAFSINLAGGTQVTATTNGSTVIFDKTIPVIQSINRLTPIEQQTDATAVTFQAVFSEKVTGVGVTDFQLTIVNGGVSGVLAPDAVTPVGSAGTTYNILVTSIAGEGTLQLDLKSASTAIADEAGNNIGGGFNSGQTYIITQPPVGQPGFASVTPLTPLQITVDTKDKPQSKVWKYANEWWCILSVSGGTKIFRLDGTSWTPVLTLGTMSGKNEVKVIGNIVHALVYKGAENNSFVYSIEYNPATNSYKLWNVRPGRTTIVFPAGSETANFAMDGAGRLWIASAGTTQVYVWYSDYPYSSWSAPISIGSGIKDDDICAITALPNEGKIAVIWSNQTTKRYGFRTHTDGTAPATWSAIESPADASALNVGKGMSDDHLNIKIGSDGTLYCATKTSYNIVGYPKLTLLVRRPNGVWDNLYTVTMNLEGTQPLVILNEIKGTMKVVYATQENGGDILYRESSLSSISFGPGIPLISGGGFLYDYATTSSENYNPDIVILATNVSASPSLAVGVLASDEAPASVSRNRSITESQAKQTAEKNIKSAASIVYPNPFTNSATLEFTLSESGKYSISLYDSRRVELSVLSQGYAEAGVRNSIQIDGSGLAAGLYLVKIQTRKSSETLKLLKK